MDETLTVEFDGGSRGNPGPGGIGFVVRAADGTALVTVGRFIGSRKGDIQNILVSDMAQNEVSEDAAGSADEPRCRDIALPHEWWAREKAA